MKICFGLTITQNGFPGKLFFVSKIKYGARQTGRSKGEFTGKAGVIYDKYFGFSLDNIPQVDYAVINPLVEYKEIVFMIISVR